MNKKIKTIRFILITILVLLVLSWIAIGIYYLSSKDKKVEYLDHELTIKSTEVVKLYEKISDLYLCQTKVSFDPFEKDQDVITVEEMDKKFIPLLIFRQLELNGDFKYNTADSVTISTKKFDEAAKQVFGYLPEFNKDFAPSGEYEYQLLNFKLVDDNYIGTKIATGCEAKFPIKRSELVKLEKTNKNLSLFVTTYEISYEQYQSNKLNDPKNSIEKYIAKNKKDLASKTYKYNFKKDKDNYYFTSVERNIKER